MNLNSRRKPSSTGWLLTGDLGRFDEASHLHLAGRKKKHDRH